MKNLSTKTNVLSLLFCALLFIATGQNEDNPPAEGFNTAASDKKAIEIADQVMQKLGGRNNWDATRYITWKFFGRRFHVWDKHTGNIRVEDKARVTLMNIHTKEGRVWESGTEITHPDSLAKRLDRGYRLWINDSYWLVMPYKLKDSGVTLKYVGGKKTEAGADAEVIQLTFENVGVTPNNKYEIFVNKETGMVDQWAFYHDAGDEKPRFNSPWQEWQQHGNIMLSAKRGNNGHTDVAVYDELPDSVFESPEPVDFDSIQQKAK